MGIHWSFVGPEWRQEREARCIGCLAGWSGRLEDRGLVTGTAGRSMRLLVGCCNSGRVGRRLPHWIPVRKGHNHAPG